ncbi:hypothetical protein [Clostridium perfringens]|uniref:hypothetical protein n=1 Tax=Clostridium perfringens TaxID=1502 RepID=UPI00123F34E2|nr:hypothetical protein [Clostridium perfringens]MDU7725587.1 hypothetical protein [Clostridium perfringens]BDA29147.1 hypothetical protein CPBEC3_22820 [Clostridium perfringens]HAT4252578.1 hypothetical protein [Clostridium perfringens]HAT4269845.1 hypothetical protein [Clostridium perfringens]HCG3172212.1 hypothetical protein [Clostridium perfringens]
MEKTSVKVGVGESAVILDRIEANKYGGSFILEVKSLGKKAVRYEVKYNCFGEFEIEIKVEAPKNIKSLDIQQINVKLGWETSQSTYGLEGDVIYKDGKRLAEVGKYITEYNVEKLNRHTIYSSF